MALGERGGGRRERERRGGEGERGQTQPYRPHKVEKIYRLLDHASMGSPGHGPVHLLIDSALEIGFSWDSEKAG